MDSMGRLKGNSTRLAPVGTGPIDPGPGLVGAFDENTNTVLPGLARFAIEPLHAAFAWRDRAKSRPLKLRGRQSGVRQGPAVYIRQTRPTPSC